MAILIDWEYVLAKDIKKTLANKWNKKEVVNKNIWRNCWFIWNKPSYSLFEWIIVKELEKEYEIKATWRKWEIYNWLVSKDLIRF